MFAAVVPLSFLPVSLFGPRVPDDRASKRADSADLFYISSPPELILATQQRYTVICVVLPAKAALPSLTFRAFSVSTSESFAFTLALNESVPVHGQRSNAARRRTVEKQPGYYCI